VNSELCASLSTSQFSFPFVKVYSDVEVISSEPRKVEPHQVFAKSSELGGVDGFDQDEACSECDNGCEISLRLLAS
jgi:hypothetical protein